ncbi:hypothetical protein KKF84_21000 [Myxococcota bacterium]|nr:hypothetical protein [Myxococcota bacterium]MBU1537804.1 hypothetical protein [Myxococcota bacterium]
MNVLMYYQPLSPQEHQILLDRHTKFRTGFIGAIVLTSLMALFMIAQDLVIVAIILGGGGAYGAILLHGQTKLLSQDLGAGKVRVFRGPVEKKSIAKNSLEMTTHLAFIDGESQTLSKDFYAGIDEGDVVEIHRGQFSPTLTFARLLNRQGMEPDATTVTPACPHCGGIIDPHRGVCNYCYPEEEQTDPEGRY